MEINVILSAIQSAFATSVQQAVAAATAPLVERIDALEKNEEYLTRRITALEGDVSHKVQVQQANIVAALADRIAALETKLTEANLFTQNTNVTIPIDEAKMVEALNSQEWFWHKVAGFVTNNGIDDELVRIKQRVEALESETQGENRYLNRDEVNDLIAEAIDDHLGTYDHDDYDQVSSNLSNYDLDDFVTNSGIEDAVRDALNGTSVTLSF